MYIVDDDEGVRRALARVFKSVGFQSHQFSSTKHLMAANIYTDHSCVIADLNIAGDDPVELPARLRERRIGLPVVFVSAAASDKDRAKVMSAGGFGLFHKPVDSQALIDAVQWAIERQEASHHGQA